ncbi:hypothetical protein JB92DRAFT_2859366 [Gautieria morchelliformis]|nr:hypothetical protein JB92DRAFT_2859366 [Gautieria morchelliformis]
MQSLQTIILAAIAIMTAQTSARTLNQRGLEAFAARSNIVCNIFCEPPQIQTMYNVWRNVSDPGIEVHLYDSPLISWSTDTELSIYVIA